MTSMTGFRRSVIVTVQLALEFLSRAEGWKSILTAIENRKELKEGRRLEQVAHFEEGLEGLFVGAGVEGPPASWA